MSKFRGQAGSGSDASANDLSEIIDEERSEIEVVELAVAAVGNKYLQGSDIDTDDEGVKKKSVVKLMIDQLKNAIKINDWVNLLETFDKLNKQLEKVTESVDVPKLYVRALVMLEDFLSQSVMNKEAMKNMSSSNLEAFNSMKQKLKKNNQQYEELIQRFRETTEDEEEGEDAEEYENSGSECVAQIVDDDDEEENDDDDDEEEEDDDDGEDDDDEEEEEDDDDDQEDLNGNEPFAAWEKSMTEKHKLMGKEFTKRTLSGFNYEIVRKMVKDLAAGRVEVDIEKMEQLKKLYLRR